jgi:hypothetical protein
MKRTFIHFKSNKMALFAYFASKQISKLYMRNKFRPDANFRFKRIFKAKCSEHFVKELNIVKPNLKVHCSLPTDIAHCTMCTATAHCPLPIVHCLLSTAHCLLPTAHCLLQTANCLLSFAYCYCSQFTVHCSLLTVHCLLPTVCYPLFLLSTVYYPPSTAHCAAVHCPLPTVLFPLSTTHCTLPTVHCPLSTAQCLMPPVRCIVVRCIFGSP